MLAGMSERGELLFEPRFCGPPGSVNGGFACGTLAGPVGGPAEVSLRRPIPLGRALAVRSAPDGALTLLDGEAALAEARPGAGGAPPPPPAAPPGVASAVAGSARYYADPTFPGCFVCGTDRAPGD